MRISRGVKSGSPACLAYAGVDTMSAPVFFLADITASLFLHEKAEVSGTLSGLRSESVADGDGISSQEFFRFHRPFPFGLNL